MRKIIHEVSSLNIDNAHSLTNDDTIIKVQVISLANQKIRPFDKLEWFIAFN